MLTSLYIHIPFCNQICTYCDFVKEIATFTKKEHYIEALRKELKQHKDLYKELQTIYIGGGTPSSLPKSLLEPLLQDINEYIDVTTIKEFTIECNPNDVTKEFIMLIKKYNINRVSVGIQTFNKEQLSFLNREHTVKDIYHSIELLKEYKIPKISVDLIFSLIDQTREDILYDIQKFIELDITHLSYYSLILEEKTILKYLIDNNKVSLQDEDFEAEAYELIIDTLQEHGFQQYEVSNFSKNNDVSLHNLTYWTNKEYLGIGAGAHGLIDNKRYKNDKRVSHYIDKMNSDQEIREYYERNALEEELLMGLRLLKGINVEEVNQQYSIDLFSKYDKFHTFIEQELLEYKKGYLRFTRKGLLLGNLVFASILGV